ncbi:hypothetical protein HDU96_001716, partial [Phlyctochytrium bullatum]
MEAQPSSHGLTRMVREDEIRHFRLQVKKDGQESDWDPTYNDSDLELSHPPQHHNTNKHHARFDSDPVDDHDLDNGRDTFMDDIYDIVDSVVPRTDNTETPVVTFRVVLIGTVFMVFLATLNTVFTFRTNQFFVGALIATLISFPMGTFLSKAIPRNTTLLGLPLNPGPFSIKEHALIYVISSCSANPAYALFNIVAQRHLQGDQGIDSARRMAWAICFAVGAQMIGYGMAGLCRRFLVRPAAMLWPANLSLVAILTSLHAGKEHPGAATWADVDADETAKRRADEDRQRMGNKKARPASWESADSDFRTDTWDRHPPPANAWQPAKHVDEAPTPDPQQEEELVQQLRAEGKKKFRFFWIVAAGMFCYQFLPAYAAPGLAAVSAICLAAPQGAQTARMLGSPRHGLGLGAVTFDWSIVSFVLPIVTPLWALMNQLIGLYLMLWLLIPLLWSSNFFGSDRQLGTNPLQGPNGTGRFPLGLAMNSADLFDRDGTAISIFDLLITTNAPPAVTGNATDAPSQSGNSTEAPVRHGAQGRRMWDVIKAVGTARVEEASEKLARRQQVPFEAPTATDDTALPATLLPTSTSLPTTPADANAAPPADTPPEDLPPLQPRPSFLQTQLRLDETAYAAMAPIKITTYFAVEYGAAFAAFAATLVHVALWYGNDIVMRLRTNVRDLDAEDVHAKLIDRYPEVPDTWYAALLFLTTLLVLLSGQFGGQDLPWWATLSSLGLILVTILPLGVIMAISGQSIGLNVVSEFVAGWMLEGRMASVMAFKTVGYFGVFQGLACVQDLKLGHYLKVPPRVMMGVQVVATAVATVIHVVVAEIVLVRYGNKVDGSLEGWDAVQYEVFMNAGAIWGLIGPRRFFGPNSPYRKLLYCFALGAILPVLPYLLHKLSLRLPPLRTPTSTSVLLNPLRWPWHLVNVPLLISFPVTVSSLRADLVTPLIVALVVNVGLRRWRPDWWKSYAYPLSAAFDTGAAVALLLLFGTFTFDASNKVVSAVPFHLLNRFDLDGCAPDYFIK